MCQNKDGKIDLKRTSTKLNWFIQSKNEKKSKISRNKMVAKVNKMWFLVCYLNIICKLTGYSLIKWICVHINDSNILHCGCVNCKWFLKQTKPLHWRSVPIQSCLAVRIAWHNRIGYKLVRRVCEVPEMQFDRAWKQWDTQRVSEVNLG